MHEVPYYDSHQQPDERKKLEVPTTKPKARFQWPPDCLWPFTDHRENETERISYENRAMSTVSKKYEGLPADNLRSDEQKCPAIEFTRSFVHDLVNKLAVNVGHCDLLSDDLKQGSRSAKRVVAIQEIGRGMAQELNEYQYRLSKSVRSVGMQKRDVA